MRDEGRTRGRRSLAVTGRRGKENQVYPKAWIEKGRLDKKEIKGIIGRE